MLTPLCLHTPTVQPDESSRRQGHHGAAIPLNGNGHGNSGRECRIGKGTLWPEEAETTGSRHRVFPDYRSNAPAHMVLAVENDGMDSSRDFYGIKCQSRLASIGQLWKEEPE